MILYTPYIFTSNTPYGTSTLIGKTGISTDSLFIPVFAGKTGTVLNFTGFTEKAVIYNLFVGGSHMVLNRARSFGGDFINTLIYQHSMKMIPPVTRTSSVPENDFNYTYYGCKGTLFVVRNGIVEILLSLAIRSDDFFTVDTKNPDLSKFILLVSNNLLLPVHKYMYSKLKTLIFSQEVDVLWTDDISKYTFGNNFTLPNFTTIQERIEYLSDVKNFI